MFLDTGIKTECFGCEACVQVCGKNAITMAEDDEGFRYPFIDPDKCVGCGQCREVCPYSHPPRKHNGNKYVFGGYHQDSGIRFDSTSGGAFSAIADVFCDENYVIFGVEGNGITVHHSSTDDKRALGRYRKSKYIQSVVGTAYKDAKKYLREGKKVLFSGTPCQIAGLQAYLGEINQDKLLTVEVICEGVPSPLYIRKLAKYLEKKHGIGIENLDYRYTGRSLFSHGKWDFQIMRIQPKNKQKPFQRDRWFNPFWSIWLNHLMSRPACYQCGFTTSGRVADITLGDLWGVHLYCPELYGKNGGSSLIVCNTEKGKAVCREARRNMTGHELVFEDALKYQSPMRQTIKMNPDRSSFMDDLKSEMEYGDINRKWAKRANLKLLYKKYIWGNRQKIFAWNLRNKILAKRG